MKTKSNRQLRSQSLKNIEILGTKVYQKKLTLKELQYIHKSLQDIEMESYKKMKLVRNIIHQLLIEMVKL